MYKEAASGWLGDEWKITRPMDFHHFCDRLSGQMLNYHQAKRVYPGDSQFRVSTKQHAKRRLHTDAKFKSKKGKLSATTVASGGSAALQTQEYKEAIHSRCLCTSLGTLAEHLKSFIKNPSKW